MNWKETPIFILTKDRASCLRAMLERLALDGLNNLHVIDTGSTYPPMVEYLNSLKCHVIQTVPLEHHAPKFILWDANILKETGYAGQHFVYTDCDTVPDYDCPNNWLEHLYQLLAKYKDFRKAGMGLRLNDLPDCYAYKADVIKHESVYWNKTLENHVFDSFLDTTLSLYAPDTPHIYRCIRTGGKYLVRHLPWYYNTANLPEEERYYMARMHSHASFWTRRDWPKHRPKHETNPVPTGEQPGGGTQPDPGPKT